MNEFVKQQVGRAAITDPHAASAQDFRTVVRAWLSASRTLLWHASFAKGLLVTLLYLIAAVGGYNLYVLHSTETMAPNSLFNHQQWVPGIALSWGWQVMPQRPWSNLSIQECLSQGVNLTAPVVDMACNPPIQPTGYYGFPFSVSDGNGSNSVAEEFNNIISVALAASIMGVLWFKFLSKRAMA